MALTDNVFTRYSKNPLDDTELREFCNIPDNKYYTVSIWPVFGKVTIDKNRSRTVPINKISKSNQV